MITLYHYVLLLLLVVARSISISIIIIIIVVIIIQYVTHPVWCSLSTEWIIKLVSWLVRGECTVV